MSEPPPEGQQGQPRPGGIPGGPYGPTYARRPEGLPSWAKTLFGFLIGLPVSILSPFVAFAIGSADVPIELKVLVVTVVPPLLAVPLLFFRSTRPWGVGAMLGLAVGSFVLGGACVSLVAGGA